MSTNDLNLVWIDLEMTGLDTVNDHIIEIATIITDAKMKIIAEGPVFAITQTTDTLNSMDDWNTKTHTQSGLIDRIKNHGVTLEHAETATLEFIKKYVQEGKSPLAGNSICQDRRFLFREMPKLEQYFHYRNLDVSTLKELALRLNPEIVASFNKKAAHTALADIIESIQEMQYYQKHFLKTNQD